MPRERPILFSAPMVRSILDGRKSQTRRIVKPAELQRADAIEPHESYPGEWSPWIDGEPRATIECPYGITGDLLWVRETFAEKLAHTGRPLGWTYRADGERAEYELGGGRWSPSIFMPRAASRITLTVTDVRVERLQQISRGDAMAEGCPFANMAKGPDPRQWYAGLWNQLNGKGSWDASPLVWVVTFRRMEAAECACAAGS